MVPGNGGQGEKRKRRCLPDWTDGLDSALRRVCAWRVPPQWSLCDWFEEIKAQGAAAAWKAVCDFDPCRGVPFTAFVHQRVLRGALTRYRQEWRYALRCSCHPGDEERAKRHQDSLYSSAALELLRHALASLPEPDRRLIEQLFWEGKTEAEIATTLGISQQAVSKRKQAMLRDLFSYLHNGEGMIARRL